MCRACNGYVLVNMDGGWGLEVALTKHHILCSSHHACRYAPFRTVDTKTGAGIAPQLSPPRPDGPSCGEVCVIGMKGVNECLDVVSEVYRLCAAMDTDVEVVLRPRMDDWQKHADALSKYKVASQWGLKPRIYNLLLAQPELGGHRPDIDMFASY